MSAVHRWVAGGAGLLALTLGGGVPAQAIGGGAPSAAGAYAFVAKVDVGDRSCSGALVDRQWVATAASCFPENIAPGETVPKGIPKKATTATIGRTDLSGTAGRVVRVTELVGRPDRNLVLARLAEPVTDIAPVRLSTTAPAAGDVLRVAGYGRTTTEWVPDLLHSAQFSVESVAPTTLNITGHTPADASICKGDSGGPAVREVGGAFELVAINHASWQGGCYGETETRRGAVETRVDTAVDWIRDVTDPSNARTGDVTGINNLCLDVSGVGTDNGTPFILWPCHPKYDPVKLAQTFTATSDGSLRIMGKCLDMNGPQTGPGQFAHLFECNGTPAQKWEVRGDGSIVSVRNGHCLDGTDGQAGSRVSTHPCHSGDNQKWTMPTEPVKTGRVVGVSDLCLDVSGASYENRTNFILWSCHPAYDPVELAQTFSTNADGSLRVMGKCLDMNGPPAEGPAKYAYLFECNGTAAQKWELRADGSIVTAVNGNCLDGTFGQKGSRVTTHPCHGGANQKWTKPTTTE